MHNAKLILASVCDEDSFGRFPLTTLEIVFPRIVLAELNTHHALSKNSASSRAIPIEKMLNAVVTNPYIPSHWGRNQKGMQAYEELMGTDRIACELEWLKARDAAVNAVTKMRDIGLHKQIANRLLEPFMWHTVIVTATEWSNFFNLRCHPAAHPDIRIVAEKMRAVVTNCTPQELKHWQWHLPYVQGIDHEEIPVESAPMVSVGRCARVSYLTHDGVRDPQKDIQLHDDLLKSGHMSPFEHVARPCNEEEFAYFESREKKQWLGPPYSLGNFRGWVQCRKLIHNEWDMLQGASASV